MSEGRIVVGGSDITEAVSDVFENDLKAKVLKGNRDQLKIAKLHADNPHNMIDGIGEVYLSVEPEVFHATRYNMQQEMKDPNYNCWKDPYYCEWVWKNFPQYRGSSNKRIVSSAGIL